MAESITKTDGAELHRYDETDVFQKALAAQQDADVSYAVAEDRWNEIQKMRGSNSVTNAVLPLIKRYWPAVAASGGISALVTDPSMVSGLLSKLSSFLGG